MKMHRNLKSSNKQEVYVVIVVVVVGGWPCYRPELFPRTTTTTTIASFGRRGVARCSESSSCCTIEVIKVVTVDNSQHADAPCYAVWNSIRDFHWSERNAVMLSGHTNQPSNHPMSSPTRSMLRDDFRIYIHTRNATQHPDGPKFYFFFLFNILPYCLSVY